MVATFIASFTFGFGQRNAAFQPVEALIPPLHSDTKMAVLHCHKATEYAMLRDHQKHDSLNY